ncbi:MAG: hypothetical protein ISS02_02400 [Candidatus Portnoybacteria bacterium]|nr:hypothetical protein [Candidatus Portnoybacteria bacterium]
MELKDLKRKLYKPESDFEERLKVPELFQPEKEREKKSSKEWSNVKKNKFLFSFSLKQKRYLFIGAMSSVFIFLIIAGFMFWHGLTSFDVDDVKLEINGPERIISGEEVVYKVKYQNNTKLSLKNVKLVFHYPEGSIHLGNNDLIESLNLADLKVGQENQVEFPVRIIGLKDEIKKVSVRLSYEPGDITSVFNNQSEFSSEIISVPLILNFDIPKKLVNGQSFEFSLKFLNQSDVSFNNLQIKLEYPSGFIFKSSEPQTLKGNSIWSVDEINAGQEVEIFINGNIQGEEGDNKPFKAQVGILDNNQFIPYSESISALKISSSPLSAIQTVNGSSNYIAEAGEKLDYQINYKNTTDVGIRSVVITSKLEGNALDYMTLDLKEGSFDGNLQTITWRASNLPELEFLGPGQEGTVKFSIKVKKPLPINNYSDKNFEIINKVKVDSLQAPLSLKDIDIAGQNETLVKIKSQLTVQAQAYYNDDLIGNSGPIPPKVGQTTTYTIKLRLINSGNDLNNVKVEAFLPPHVKWVGKFNPSNSDLKYNFNTGQLIWNVGDLISATGILSPVKETAFQVSITPGLANVGNLLELIGQSRVSGYDDFVSLEVSGTDKPIDTDLPDDLTVSRKQGMVIE